MSSTAPIAPANRDRQGPKGPFKIRTAPLQETIESSADIAIGTDRDHFSRHSLYARAGGKVCGFMKYRSLLSLSVPYAQFEIHRKDRPPSVSLPIDAT